jgi:hypothetical protein
MHSSDVLQAREVPGLGLDDDIPQEQRLPLYKFALQTE